MPEHYGKSTDAAEYTLADETYARLLAGLTMQKFTVSFAQTVLTQTPRVKNVRARHSTQQ
jgi:hypothetical protein